MRQSLISILMLIISLSAYAQESDYMKAMVAQKNAFTISETLQDFQNLADNFERISNTTTDQWYPLYYAALSCINMSFVEKDNVKKDTNLDDAQKFIDKALEIFPEESEIWVLQGLLYQGRIQIDPMKRGKDFSANAGKALNKSKELDPENPRTYYLLGLNILHTPKFFGGGSDAACPKFSEAKEKFAAFVPGHILAPEWGGKENDKLYNDNCVKSK